jgi:aspartate racemase
MTPKGHSLPSIRLPTIGLLGGMNWLSTESYYRRLNEGVIQRLGPGRSASLLIDSIDYAWIAEALAGKTPWSALGKELTRRALRLQNAGADALMICSNTMHKFAPAIATALEIPLLSIFDGILGRVDALGVKRIGLLATAFTCRADFYHRPFDQAGVQMLLAGEGEREAIDRVLLEEVPSQAISEDSRRLFAGSIEALVAKGAEAILFGCTEVGLVVGADAVPVPVIDSLQCHVDTALRFSGDQRVTESG